MKTRGSITIFLAMLLTAVFAAVFAFLEAGRVSGLSANAKLSTAQVADAVLASYDRELCEKYDLLFWRSPDGDLPELYALKSLQQTTVEGNRKETILPRENYYVLSVHLAEVNIPNYQLATDHAGAPFRAQAADRMKESIATDALSTVTDWLNGTKQQQENLPDLENQALNALEDLHEAEDSYKEMQSQKEDTSVTEASAGTDLQTLPEVEMTENPLEWVKKSGGNGIFSLILPEEEMSEKQIDLSDCMNNRILLSGNEEGTPAAGAADKLLFRLYLDKYYKAFTDKNHEGVLDYELEYIIAGKSSDRENMKHAIRRLLLVREASNLVFLETNTTKQEEAHAIAGALCTAILSPELEPAVQQGVLAAWALAESVSDVRILLEGGKVSMIKTEEQWHTDIGSLSSSIYASDARAQNKGLTYKNYLQVLLWTTSEKQITYRAMDLIEKNCGLHMDQMLSAAECEYTYEAKPLFWNLVTLGDHAPGMFQFQDSRRITFLRE